MCVITVEYIPPCCQCGAEQGKRYSGIKFGVKGKICSACVYRHMLNVGKAARSEADDDMCVFLPDEATLRRECEARLAADLDAESRDMMKIWAAQDENAAQANAERAKVRAEREAQMVGMSRASHALGCLPFDDFDQWHKVGAIGREVFRRSVKRNPELWGSSFG